MVNKLNDGIKLAIEFLAPATIGIILIEIVGSLIQGNITRTITMAIILILMIYPLNRYLNWYYKKFF